MLRYFISSAVLFQQSFGYHRCHFAPAVKAKEEAQAMKAEYEKNMQEAKNKANDIVMTAQKTAAIQSEEMLKEASSQVTAMKEKAEKDIAQENC